MECRWLEATDVLEKTHGFTLTKDLEFHILELPKFTKQVDELQTGLDYWLYYLCHAASLDLDHLPAAMQNQALVTKALEDLQMLGNTEVERTRYEARLRAQMDHDLEIRAGERYGLKKGRKIGRKKGLEQGWKEAAIKQIQMYQELLNRPIGANE